MDSKTILSHLPYKENDILTIFPYGSRVYGTHTEQSDYDYIVVIKGDKGIKEEIREEVLNVTIYDEVSFQKQLDEHEISVLECVSLDESYLLVNKRRWHFTIDKNQLRNAISKKASNSWVKAKKKLIVKEDFDLYIAKKSLFHSLRILLFGSQLAQYGKIVNFSEANHYWNILKEKKDVMWSHYEELFKKEFNELKSSFKKVAPK